MDGMLEKVKTVCGQMKNKQFASVYMVYGVEHYFIKLLLATIKKNFEDPVGVNVTTFNDENFDFKEAMKTLSSMPFMCDRKLIIFYNIGFLESKKNKKIDVESFVKRLEETKDINIVFIANYEKLSDRKYNDKYKQDKFLVPYVNKNGMVFESSTLSDKDLMQYIVKYFSKNKKEIDGGTVQYLIKNCGTNLINLFNEADKLIIYVGENSKIKKEDIDEICLKSIEDNVFKMIDYLNTNNKKEALNIYGMLLSVGTSYYSIFSMLANNYENMLIVKDLVERGDSLKEITEKLKMPDWKVRKIITANKSINKNELVKKINTIVKLREMQMRSTLTQNLMVELLFY